MFLFQRSGKKWRMQPGRGYVLLSAEHRKAAGKSFRSRLNLTNPYYVVCFAGIEARATSRVQIFVCNTQRSERGALLKMLLLNPQVIYSTEQLLYETVEQRPTRFLCYNNQNENECGCSRVDNSKLAELWQKHLLKPDIPMWHILRRWL